MTTQVDKPIDQAPPVLPLRQESVVLRYLASPLFLRDLLLIGLTLFALGGVVANGFVDFDDKFYVAENSNVLNGLSPTNVSWAFTSWEGANWHPLTWLSLQLDATLCEPVPYSFHRTNLLLHLVNVLLLAEVLRRMTGALWPSAIVAGLFAVHPLHVESVAWISERKDVLSTLFGLLALAAYVRYARRPTWWAMGLVLLAQGASLLAKSMLVTLPFLLLLLDYWPLARKPTHCGGWESAPPTAVGGLAGKERKRGLFLLGLVVEKIPLFLLSAGFCLLTLRTQSHGNAVESLQITPLSLRLANAVDATVCYLGQTFYPVHLAVFYPYPHEGIPWQRTLAEVLLLLGITGAVCWLARSRPYLLVGWFWFLGTLVPVVGLVQVGSQARADRYTYIPLIGLFLMLTWGTRDLLGRARPVLFVLSAGCLLICVFLSRAQVRHWEDPYSLWDHTVAVTTDNALARINLAAALRNRGESQAALVHLEEAIRIKPKSHMAHFNRGKVLEQFGDLDGAEAAFQKAVDLQPDNGIYLEALLDLRKRRQDK